MNTAREAAAHWRSLAKSERRMAAHEEALGRPRGSTDVYYHKADTYDRTARALELEAETGKVHCSMCFGPHPNHEHKAGV